MILSAAQGPLPSPPDSLICAIEAGQVLWESGPNTATTVKVSLPGGKPAAVRYGKHVRIPEALAVQYVQQHSPVVPVASVIAIYSLVNPEDPGDTVNYIVSEWIDGNVLEDVWESLSPSERDILFERIRDIVKAIRQIPLESSKQPYIGSVGHNPCGDPLLAGLGPFPDIAALNGTLLELAKPYFRHAYSSIVQRMLERTQKYRIVFTHGDIAPRNIIVRRSPEVGWEVAALIDWECAGFYPEHWEYLKSLNVVEWKSDWAKRVQFMLDQHYDEDFLLDTRLRFYYRM